MKSKQNDTNTTDLNYMLYVFELENENNVTIPMVKKQYKKLLKKYHPDLHPEQLEWAEYKTKKINAVYKDLIEFLEKQEKEKTEKQEMSHSYMPKVDLPPPTSAYNIYKRGFILADRAFTYYYELKLKHPTIPEILYKQIKKELQKAKNEFAILVKQYPKNKWTDDAIEKINKINLWLKEN